MSILLSEEQDGKIVIIEATGKLAKQDYEQFMPKVEQHIKTFNKIRMVFAMKNFHGWEVAALWQDLKFDLKHFRHIERLAMVGDKKWEKGMSVFCKPFTTAKIRYFDASKSDQAYDWIRED
jgi:hypothetical protein